jgi:hypothetical protein
MSERWLWTQKQDIGPSPRFSFAMTYDSERKKVVLFGGSTGPAELNDTWEWDGHIWTQIADMGPSNRWNVDMVYDSDRDRIVLFGGIGPHMADTWELNGAEWTQVADTGPAGRYGHAMAYHQRLRGVVLFGGSVPKLQPKDFVGDTWAWNGSEWTQIQDTGPLRTAHGMVYDNSRDCLVVFGGISRAANGIDLATLKDTWEFENEIWIERQEMGPGIRSNVAMTFIGARTVLFGGIDGSGKTLKYFNDTWEWDGMLWRERQNMGPPARCDHRIAYDSARDRVVLFGGGSIERKAIGDTWELQITATT